jgi:2-oxoglutarate dehydrogenase E1 component
MDVALVRLEQLYPLPEEKINAVLEKYKGKPLIWAQEEPKNMGAWTHILNRLQHLPFELIASRPSAATASGSSKQAAHRQRLIIEEVFK